MSAFWIGDRMHGTNPYTGETVTGTLVSLDTSELDGKVYATLATPGGEVVMPPGTLSGPRRCTRPTPREPWDGTCARCGREIYVNGPYDAESYTHHQARVASRYR